jgi:transcriptional regulator with XRE-family HTH domain
MEVTEKTISNLKVLLLEADVPQYQVAAKCGLHPSQLSRYALQQDEIKPKHLRALCRFFRVTQQELLGSSTFSYQPEAAE